MTAQDLLLTSFGQRYEIYKTEHTRCKAEFSEGAVHDLRVSTRRFLAIVLLLRAVQPDQNLRKLCRLLKDQLDSLDDLRDTQVMLAEISETLKSLPELAPFQKFLLKQEKRLLTKAQFEVGEFKSGTVSRKVESLLARLSEPAFSQDLLTQLSGCVDDAFFKVVRRSKMVDSTRSASIHRVRVAFKKFRYMLEIIYPLLPGLPDEQFKRMHGYQAGMGEIQDVEVFLQNWDAFVARRKILAPEQVRSFYEQRHMDLVNAYVENMNEFVTFWRPEPDQPFPWQTREKVTM
ncbi:MAG: CHAD domain-containing protein [Chloroflexota bacterium]